ncbi:putative N-alpha-acetyltransferase 16, NatA auxiliary subunit [Glarea lozoyensis 74030]|uniref:Putative N-alpha-acetyltransferase 16, NatA auxiliary subunit n=1 Tax=Glarea lozoyensis (strain ATCC 74030 / MF5533) TaxID=1104152 RepID=H0EQD9_GLAL7|nr:putative N-alpha-acetyltransferase 16, NatA auxiliary subunit [Glarea lozoyensis 74030]
MLTARPSARQSWTALAVAHHLNGNLSEAEGVLTSYEETLKNPPSKTDFENSEAVMYKNSLIAEQGDFQKALDHLESAGKHTLDRLAYYELRATYLTKLGRTEEATKAYRALIDRNSEYKMYYDGLIEAMGISEDKAAKKQLFDEYAEKYPRCDEFKEAADQYINRMLDKGVPSTFANLKHLYSSSFKKDTLPALVQQYIDSGKSEANDEPKRSGDTSKGASAAFYFLAQHYNYYRSRDLDKAMEFVEKAIELEPNSVDFHMTQARIWKHYGNSQKASEIMEKARTLDTRDRHINTKAAKYQLRDNEGDAALKTMGLFTRAETVGGPLADLHDMHFSLRKGQIRAYIDMMRWEDQLREHTFYSRAALSAVDVYLKLHDKPLSNGTNGNSDANGDDAAERKKAAKKARKEAQKAEREAIAKKNEPNKATKEVEADPKKKDDDPDGAKLAATTEPMNDAMKFLTPLLQFSPKSIDVQTAGFEVYMRRKKYVLALKCLLAAAALDKEHSKVHQQIVRFKVAIDSEFESSESKISPKTKEVITSEFNLLPASTSLTKFNDDYLASHKDCARRTLSALSVRKLISPDAAPTCEKDVAAVLKLSAITVEEAQEALTLLRSWNSSEVDAFKSSAAQKWPKATIFE